MVKKSTPYSGRMREHTPTLMKGENRKERRSRSFLQVTLFSLILTLVCIISDYATIFPLLDEFLTQSERQGQIVTAAISAVENSLPLVAVYFLIRHRYQPARYSLIPFWLILVSLTVMFGILFYFRWEAIPFSIDHLGVAEDQLAARDLADQATAIMLGILPVVTSLANGLLYYISPNVYDKRHKALRMRILELTQQRAEINATIEVLRDNDSLEALLAGETSSAFSAAADDVDAVIERLKEKYLIKLSEKLHDPNILTRHRYKQ